VGHLELTCCADAAGRSHLSRQSFNAPFHISKPYWDGQILTVQMINPTAGLFAGDSLRCDVRVEPGARLNITTPSATRVFTMPEGRAEIVQTFVVARDSSLAFMPSMLVPHRVSRYRQTTRITVEPGGELFYVETLAPGRVAHGECFEFTEIDVETELRHGPRLNARERFRLRPDDSSLKPLRTLFPSAYWASCYLITPRLTDDHSALNRIRELHGDDLWLGVSRLALAGWSIKLIASGSWQMNRAIAGIRQILSEALPAFVLPLIRF
jgi:urease accessory protein